MWDNNWLTISHCLDKQGHSHALFRSLRTDFDLSTVGVISSSLIFSIVVRVQGHRQYVFEHV